MNRWVSAVSVGVVAGLFAAAQRAVAGNGWMMEKMADDLKRVNEQVVRAVPLPANGRVELEAAVKTAPGGAVQVRVDSDAQADGPRVRRLPQEKAETPEYVSSIKEARLNIPVVAVK